MTETITEKDGKYCENVRRKTAETGRWFRESGYGMMVHWGLYAMLGGEWKGRRMNTIGEWAQAYFRIPNAEYQTLARAFNPVLFNADEWVQLARDAGMKYLEIGRASCRERV